MSKFARRIDNTPLEDVTDAELCRRVDDLDAELKRLAHDAAHVRTDTHGAEQAKHRANIARERTDAEHKRTVYSLELATRKVHS